MASRHAQAAAVRAAFAVGWAGTGAPLTARAHAACAAALAATAEYPDAPGVVEATLRLGSLEGTWALVYARREKLYAAHEAAIVAAWRAWAGRLDTADAVDQFRRRGHTEDTATEQQRRREREAAAIAILLLLLRGMAATDRRNGTPEYGGLLDAIEAALRQGSAEGVAGAVAVLAQRAGHAAAVDFQRAYEDALAAAAGEEQYRALAEAWLKRIIEAAARDGGRTLADSPPDVPDEDTADEVTDTVAGDNPRAASTFADWLLGAAFWLGMSSVYAALSVGAVNWVTVGDDRVCRTCQSNEDNSPYPTFEAPPLPAHPRCRCWLDATGPITALGVYAKYLIGG